MAHHSIHVVAGEHQDWIVREQGGRELGHYPTKLEAEAVGRAVARKRRAELLVYDVSGKVNRSNFSRRWFSRLVGR
jgi:Uncharacterized protein conserved in bacteria (DUF2188)